MTEKRREQMRAARKRWYAKNREFSKQRSKEWIKANPEKHKASVRKQRASLHGRFVQARSHAKKRGSFGHYQKINISN